ncbi:MAG: RluA family pseudouridine synthase [Mycoplasmatales bacterium]|nr:RluA family pseudouridine synthase [Mycoplasmatales bacterium]
MNLFIAKLNDSGRNLLKFLEQMFKDVPKSRIEKLFRKKDIKINGVRTSDKKYILKENDKIEVYGIEHKVQKFNRTKINFDIVFEDENILIVNKPEGVVIHGSDSSLDMQVLSHLKYEKNSSFIPSHIGRIDKVTSGIVVYGKNYETVKQMNQNIHKFEKIYRAISELNKTQVLKMKIHHNEIDKKEYMSKFYGKDTITNFKVLENGEIEAQIITGRKHQIRAALEYLKFPIKGDVKYGGIPSKRVYLHSYKITFHGLVGKLEYLNNASFKTEVYF